MFPYDLYCLMNKVKTSHLDSDKAQIIENITLNY